MSKVFNPLMILLSTAAAFRMDNPEMAEFMDSPEETERLHNEFEKFIDEEKAKEQSENVVK